MNFLGIGPGEIFFILILLLVVVGPERLPEFARGAGRFVVRVRNWIARSPDAQLVLRAREELELELDELRRSLTEEVEVVRKELETVRGDLAEATKLVEESAEEVARTRIELEEIADAVDESAQTIAPRPASVGVAQATPGETPSAAPPPAGGDAIEVDPGPIGSRKQAIADRAAANATEPAPANGQPVPRTFKPGQPPIRPPAPAAAANDDAVAALSQRVQSLSVEFNQQIQLLTAELQILRERQVQEPTPPEESPPPKTALGDTAAVVDALGEVETPAAEPADAAAVDALGVAEAQVDARRRCKGVTRSGEPCAAPPLKGQDYCRAHTRQRVLEEVPS